MFGPQSLQASCLPHKHHRLTQCYAFVFHCVPKVFLREKDETTPSVVQAGVFIHHINFWIHVCDDSARRVPNLFHAQVHHMTHVFSFLQMNFILLKKDMSVSLDPIQTAFVLNIFKYICYFLNILSSIYHVSAKVGQQSMPK